MMLTMTPIPECQMSKTFSGFLSKSLLISSNEQIHPEKVILDDLSALKYFIVV